MPYSIELISIGSNLYDVLQEAAEPLNAAQQEFQFLLPPPHLRTSGLQFKKKDYLTTDVFHWLGEFRGQAKGNRQFLIAFIDAPLSSPRMLNLFASHEARDGVAVVTIHGTSNIIEQVPVYLAYYLIRYSLNFVAPSLANHDDTRHCFFDRKINKRDILKSLESGRLCDEHLRELKSHLNEETERSILRMIAVLTKLVHLPRDASKTIAPNKGAHVPLTPRMCQELTDAILSAYPQRSNLAQALYFSMGLRFDDLVAQVHYGAQAFQLVEVLDAQARIDELINALREHNPGNPKLIAFEKNWFQFSKMPAQPAGLAAQAAPDKAPVARLAASPVVFRWVHLSDIHFGAGSMAWRFDQRAVSAAIARDLKKLSATPPDRIFVTGDVAFSAQPDQYEAAKDWLKLVAEAAGVGVDRLRLVPGNHDVNRQSASKVGTKAAHQHIRSTPAALDDFLSDKDERSRLQSKLTAWGDFVMKLAPAHPAPASTGVDWVERLPVTKERGAVRIAGLSSVWVSDASDNGPPTGAPNLIIGRSQLEDLLGNRDDSELVFLLSHHPPGWMDPTSSTLLTRYLGVAPHIHLCGHVHSAGAGVDRRVGSGTAVRLVAGSAHDDPAAAKQHGYAWGALRHSAASNRWELGWSPRVYVEPRNEIRPDANTYCLDADGFAWEELPLRWPAPTF